MCIYGRYTAGMFTFDKKGKSDNWVQNWKRWFGNQRNLPINRVWKIETCSYLAEMNHLPLPSPRDVHQILDPKLDVP